jgi:ABC-type bacteriocin/lantibiotic exporter with double-glycine peptidase domain
MFGLLRSFLFIFEKKEIQKSWIFIFFTLINTILELAVLGFVFPVTQILLKKNIEFPLFGKLDYLNNFSYNITVYFSLILMLILFIFKNFISIYFNFWQQKFSGEIDKKLSKDLFNFYFLQPYKFYLNNNSALLGHNLLNEVPNLALIVRAFLMIFAEMFVLIAIIIVLISQEPAGSIAIMIFSLMIMFLLNNILKKYFQFFGHQKHIYLSESNKNIFQAVDNIKEIKILGREKIFLKKFEENLSHSVKFKVYYDSISIFPRSISELILILSFILLVIFLVFKNADYSVLFSTVTLFLVATYRIIPSILRITSSLQTMQIHRNVAEKILKDLKSLKSLNANLNSDDQQNLKFENEIALCNLCFAYSENREDVLSNIDFTIKKNQTIGIIGENGSGKSTLIDLLTGLHFPTKGYIEIDGVKLSDKNLKSWQSKIGYVSQNSGFIDDTIENNIVFGLADSEIDKKRVLLSLKKVNLVNFINNLPLGLNTNIGEKGVLISGGQKQRIAIARVLYRNSDVLIFDEATSALDNENEKIIFEIIKELKNSKTIIIVSHKKSLLSICHQIFEVKDKLVNRYYDL